MGKSEIAVRLIWITAIISVVTYAAYLFFGSIVSAEAEQSLREVDAFELIDRDAHLHRLSGMIMVPTACHSIAVQEEQQGVGAYDFVFTTSGESHGCTYDPQPRSFHVVFSAPLIGNTYTASLDGEPLDVRVVRRNYGTLTD